VVATSVNRAGEPPATSGSDAAILAAGSAAVVLDAGPARLGVASTVVRVAGEGIEILRHGAVPEREVLEAGAALTLFVCLGNICRSPLAAALAGQAMARREGCEPGALPRRGLLAASAGTAAETGRRCPPDALAEGLRHGVDLSGHRSRPLTPALLDRASDVLVMDRPLRESILEFLPEAARRVRLLDPAGRDIPDPFGSGPRAYQRAGAMIALAVRERFR
jgi:protein-tyrosine phosphatase